MKRISFTAYCQCCYNTALSVPDELLEEGNEYKLTEYVNQHIDDCQPIDGFEFIVDLPIEENDLVHNFSEEN